MGFFSGMFGGSESAPANNVEKSGGPGAKTFLTLLLAAGISFEAMAGEAGGKPNVEVYSPETALQVSQGLAQYGNVVEANFSTGKVTFKSDKGYVLVQETGDGTTITYIDSDGNGDLETVNTKTKAGNETVLNFDGKPYTVDDYNKSNPKDVAQENYINGLSLLKKYHDVKAAKKAAETGNVQLRADGTL